MEYDYVSLVALAAVIREGSFDAAAKSLQVTQSAISQRIKHLEDRAGALLVVRGRPCMPTELALHLCQHLEQVTLLQHELDDRIRLLIDGQEPGAVTIRISVNNDSIAYWFPNVIKRAVQELRVQLDITPDDQDYTEKNLTSGKSLAVVTSHEKTIPGCRRIPLGAMEYIAVASVDYYNAHFADGITPDTIRGTACLAFDRKDTLQEKWLAFCFGATIPTLRHMVPSCEGYLACCLNGTGWGILPTVAAEPHLKNGDLIELAPGKSIKVPLHWQSSTQSSEILRKLGDIVLQESELCLTQGRFRTG